MLRNKSLMNRK